MPSITRYTNKIIRRDDDDDDDDDDNDSPSWSESLGTVSNRYHLSRRQIAGIVLGVIAFVTCIWLVFFLYMRWKKKKTATERPPGFPHTKAVASYPINAALLPPPEKGQTPPPGYTEVDLSTTSATASSSR